MGYFGLRGVSARGKCGVEEVMYRLVEGEIEKSFRARKEVYGEF